MPGNGRVADPGFNRVMPGRGGIMMAPVSVCHQVSTTGQRSPPMNSKYHIQASGLMGSPTDPKRRSDERSWRAGDSWPHFMKVRMGVGAGGGMGGPERSRIGPHPRLAGEVRG